MKGIDERSEHAKAGPQAKAQNRPLLSSDHKDDGSSSQIRARLRVFVAIFFSLLVGLAFALGHHFMNRHLNGKPVDIIFVSQAWIFRVATALAFLVKVAFAVSVAASFVQYQWFKFHRQSFRVDEIDSLTDVLENVLRFFDTLVFVRQPVLLLIAVIAWTIPFAAVVTPGSLTVEPIRSTSTVHSYVPQPRYNSTYYANITQNMGNDAAAAPMIYKLAYITAAAGQPVALSSAFQNETYSLSFDGPIVKCFPASDALVRNMTLDYNPASSGGEEIQFISWVAGNKPTRLFYGDSTTNFYTTLDSREGAGADAASIFVMTNTGSWNKTLIYPLTWSNGSFMGINSYTVYVNITECQLYNATYDVNFAFQYPNQTREVTISKWLHPVPPASGELGYGGVNATGSNWLSYLAMMQAYGKLLVGYSSTYPHQPTSSALYSSWQIIDIDWSDATAVQSGLESLFQNLTLSMLSHKDFTKSESESDRIPITVTSYPVSYRYTQYELLMPYGLAFFFALLCAILGSFAFFSNHAAYHNVFSSFIRATSGHEYHAMLGSNSHGADPLPADLAKVRVLMGTRDGKHE